MENLSDILLSLIKKYKINLEEESPAYLEVCEKELKKYEEIKYKINNHRKRVFSNYSPDKYLVFETHEEVMNNLDKIELYKANYLTLQKLIQDVFGVKYNANAKYFNYNPKIWNVIENRKKNGVLIYGDIGEGKSSMLSLLAQREIPIEKPYLFQYYTMDSLIQEYRDISYTKEKRVQDNFKFRYYFIDNFRYDITQSENLILLDIFDILEKNNSKVYLGLKKLKLSEEEEEKTLNMITELREKIKRMCVKISLTRKE